MTTETKDLSSSLSCLFRGPSPSESNDRVIIGFKRVPSPPSHEKCDIVSTQIHRWLCSVIVLRPSRHNEWMAQATSSCECFSSFLLLPLELSIFVECEDVHSSRLRVCKYLTSGQPLFDVSSTWEMVKHICRKMEKMKISIADVTFWSAWFSSTWWSRIFQKCKSTYVEKTNIIILNSSWITSFNKYISYYTVLHLCRLFC